MDSPMATAVLGMARTTGTSLPSALRMAAIDTPDTTDTSLWRFGSR